MKSVRLLVSFVVFLQAAIGLHSQTAAPPQSGQGGFPIRFGYNRGQAGSPAASSQMRAAVASVPLFFEANQGQTDPRVRFFSRGGGYTLFLTPEETVLVESAALPGPRNKSGGLPDSRPSPRAVLRMKLLGANRAQEFVGIGKLPGKVNYLIGNKPDGWHTGVTLYSQVQAKQVYPGVDLLFHGDQQQLEYDFIVSPGADPNQVAFQIEGAERIELDPQGNLVLRTPQNEIAFHKPLVYQPVGAERRPVDGRFVLRGPSQVGFEIAAYDRRQPLVIDPTITYATFLGGLGHDDANGLALDTSTPGAPKMYVSGLTTDDTSFPETGSNVVFLTKTGASFYIFIAKIDPTLTGAASLDYLTFIGGGTPFAGTSPPCYNTEGLLTLETVNSTVEPLMSGISSCQDYPVTQGSPTTGQNDLVLTRLKPSGAALDLSEFFGGNGLELGGVVVVDSSGNLMLSALTSSTNLPVTAGAYATSLDNGQPGATVDCFVAKLDSSFTVHYLSYLNVGLGETINGLNGGEGFVCAAGEDSTGKIIAAGTTISATDFSGVPGQPNGFQTTFQGTSDTFVMKLDPSLNGTNELVYSTYLGGGGDTAPDTGAFLPNNLLAVGGNTTSGESGTPPNIPLANAYQTTNSADPASSKGTGFVTVIDTTKTGSASLVCSTYLGGTLGDEKVQGMAYDPVNGNFSTLRLILGGQTSSTTFPTLNPLQSSLVGGQDAWVAAMNVPATASGPAATLSFSTYLGEGFEPNGDHKRETVHGLTVDANHNIYAKGRSPSPSPGFFGNTNPPTSVNGFQTVCESCSSNPATADTDAVVFLLKGWQPALTISPASLTFSSQVLGTTSAGKSVTVTNSGLAPVSLLPIVASGDYAVSSDTCPADPSTLAAGLSCSFNVTFTPTVPGSVSGEITIADTAAGSPHGVNLTGKALTPIALSPTSLTFGTITVGTTSLPKTVTLTNNLSTSLTVTGIAASGDYAVAGSGTSPCVIAGMTLAAKAKCTFNVTFTPEQNATAITGAAAVAYSGSFSPQNVALTGGGTGGATASPLTFTPASLSFKNVLIGASASLSVTVKNSSASSLSISGITASGNYAAVGSGGTPCGGLLGAGATCTMTVTFNPSINGTIKGSVAIANGTAVNPQIYNVSGAAVLPLSFSPASLTFAAQTVGSTSAAKTVTLTNNVGTTMSIGFVASGDYGAFPTGGTPCGASLAAHAKCTIGVTFTPSATGTIKGVVTVTYSGVAPSFSPQEMGLTGTGQ